jgi:cytochrome c5
MKKILTILTVVLGITIFACTNRKEVIEYPTTVPCDTTVSRFSVEVKDVFDRQCNRCHGASVANTLGGGTNLQNYSTVRAYARSGILMDNITFASTGNPMPKGGSKIPDCDINKIRAWINRGSLNN